MGTKAAVACGPQRLRCSSMLWIRSAVQGDLIFISSVCLFRTDDWLSLYRNTHLKKKAEIKGPGSLVQNYLFLVFVTCLVDWINRMENAFSQTRKLLWKEMYYTYFFKFKSKIQKDPSSLLPSLTLFLLCFSWWQNEKSKRLKKRFRMCIHTCMYGGETQNIWMLLTYQK